MSTLAQYNTFVTALNTVQASGPVFNMIEKLVDGVHEDSAVLTYLKNKSKKFDSSNYIRWNITNLKRRGKSYVGQQKLNPQVQEFKKPLGIDWAHYTLDCTYTKTDLLKISTKSAFQDYVADCIDETKAGMTEGLLLDFYGNGTTDANGGVAGGNAAVINPLYGLNYAIEETPVTSGNTVYGQTRGTTTGWMNNQNLNVTSLTNLTTTDMKKMYMYCTHMMKQPDMIVTSEEGFRKVWDLAKVEGWLQESKQMVDLGLPESIKFGKAAIIPEKFMTDDGEGGYLTGGNIDRMYFLNFEDGIDYYCHPKDDMILGPVLQPTDEHSFTQHVTFTGQLVVKNPRLNGVIYWS